MKRIDDTAVSRSAVHLNKRSEPSKGQGLT